MNKFTKKLQQAIAQFDLLVAYFLEYQLELPDKQEGVALAVRRILGGHELALSLVYAKDECELNFSFEEPINGEISYVTLQVKVEEEKPDIHVVKYFLSQRVMVPTESIALKALCDEFGLTIIDEPKEISKEKLALFLVAIKGSVLGLLPPRSER